MPAKRRRQILDRRRKGAYHCYSRCVRRAFLAGLDFVSGQDYTYRREWVRARLEALASVFTIEVLDHAVMENHVHTILRNRPDLAQKLKRREVAERWLRLSRKKLELNDPPTKDEVDELLQDKSRMRKLRSRLSDISWFMIMLNEPIALKANIEDDMSGHFWAERFGSVRLENEESLLACSLYVDLNPIRAGQCESIEESTYTGACDRLRDLERERSAERERRRLALERLVERCERPEEMPEFDVSRALLGGTGGVRLGERDVGVYGVWDIPGKRIAGVTPGTALTAHERSGWMAPLRVEGDGYAGAAAGRRASDLGYLPMDVEKYLVLLDACGRQPVEGKRGRIPESMPDMISRLGLDPARWTDEVRHAAERFARIGVQCARQSAERQRGRAKKRTS
ncbi:MAG: hypothetical protein U0939_15950 [Pirellulales bacterium]